MSDLAENFKDTGNVLFKESRFAEAIEAYTNALRCNIDDKKLLTSLLSNRAFANLKLSRYNDCIDDCSAAIEVDRYHVKSYYRRAQAHEQLKQYTEAVRDLHEVLRIDAKNKDAIQLMRQIKVTVEIQKASHSEVESVISALNNNEKVDVGIKYLIQLIVNNDSVSFEFMDKGGVMWLALFIESKMSSNDFCDNLKHAFHLLLLIVQTKSTVPRLIDIVNTDEYVAQRRSVSLLNENRISYICLCSYLSAPLPTSHFAPLVSTLIHILQSFPLATVPITAEIPPTEYTLSLCAAPIKHLISYLLQPYTTLNPLPLLENYTLAMDTLCTLLSTNVAFTTPNKITDTRHESLTERKVRVATHSLVTKRSKQFATYAIELSIVDYLVALLKEEATRHKAIIVFNAIINALNDDAYMQSLLQPFMSPKENSTIAQCYTQLLIAYALLLSRPAEMGAWVLGQSHGVGQLLRLLQSGNNTYMEVAAEVLSLAAMNDATSSMLAPIVESNMLTVLLKAENSNIRTSIAATMTKLSLKAKAIKHDSAEVSTMLNIISDMFKQAATTGSAVSALHSVNSDEHRPVTSLERAVEVLATLITKTYVKEEVTHGSYRVSSLIQSLVQLPTDTPSLNYTIAYILSALSVTNKELQIAALASKDMSYEQYTQLQELQRIKAKDEDGNIIEEKKEETDEDTEELCRRRIRVLAAKGAIPLLLKLANTESLRTKTAALTAMRQMAVDESVRGLLIQQGALKLCIEVANDENIEKATRLEAAHVIGKVLVTSNPTLLSEHLRLTTYRPLLFLCKDVESTTLQQFECMLSLTNLTSCGEADHSRFVAEKGIPTAHYLMFSDNLMVRRAATELLCNLSTHEGMAKMLQDPEKIRLWLAFCEDYDNEENEAAYPTARAALGTLAMAAQSKPVCDAMMKENCMGTIAAALGSGKMELLHRGLVLVLEMLSHGGETVEYLKEHNILNALSSVPVENETIQGLTREITNILASTVA